LQLTDTERRMLDGAAGNAARKSLEILVALGEIYGAERLLPIRSAQVSGVSYANLGDAGLELLEEWARDGRTACPATLNPAGMDLQAWRAMGISAEFAERQLRIVRAYERMGITVSCTCTPYLAGNRPALDEHVAWSESSAVTFANSVLGARTNREGGPSALAAALCGCTPEYGLHLDGPRAPQVLVRVETPLDSAADWGALGAAVGRLAPGLVPLLEGPAAPAEEHLMALSAALPTFGGTPLFHLAGVTPEVRRFARPERTLAVGRRELEEAYASLDDRPSDVELVFLGCPHATLATVREVAERLRGRSVRRTLWVATSRAVRDEAEREGLVAAIAASGGLVLADTCFVVAPLAGRFRGVVTDSAKGCWYARGANAMRVRLASLTDCLATALGENGGGG
jgi:predicted aconitase